MFPKLLTLGEIPRHKYFQRNSRTYSEITTGSLFVNTSGRYTNREFSEVLLNKFTDEFWWSSRQNSGTLNRWHFYLKFRKKEMPNEFLEIFLKKSPANFHNDSQRSFRIIFLQEFLMKFLRNFEENSGGIIKKKTSREKFSDDTPGETSGWFAEETSGRNFRKNSPGNCKKYDNYAKEFSEVLSEEFPN